MDRESLLDQIKNLSAQGQISKEEILKAFEEGRKDKPSLESMHQIRISSILYYLGAIVIFSGLVILIAQHWSLFNNFTKILVTLGVGLDCFIVGVLFEQRDAFEYIAQAFFFLSGLITPIGLHVSFDLAGVNLHTHQTQLTISLILLAGYLGAFLIFKRTVLLIFTIFFGTWFFISLTNFLIGDHLIFMDSWRFDCYRILAINLTYLFLGYYYFLGETPRKILSQWLMTLGVSGFLAAALALGGWTPKQNIFWELIFPVLVFGFIYLSVYIRNKSFLIFGALYLMAYISKLTGEYFKDSLGWAFSLVLLGFFLMAVGYLAFYIHKRYIR